MTIELLQADTLTASIYDIAAESVTYIGQVDGTVDILAVVEREDEEFPSAFETQVGDADAFARLQRNDVPNPRHGDTITDVRGTIYSVDSYRERNAQEWLMEIKRG